MRHLLPSQSEFITFFMPNTFFLHLLCVQCFARVHGVFSLSVRSYLIVIKNAKREAKERKEKKDEHFYKKYL